MGGLPQELAIPQTWAVGLLEPDIQQALGSQNATVLLSDDTFGKQYASRLGQDFGLKEYQALQEVIEEADSVWLADDGRLHFIKIINNRRFYAILKTTKDGLENYILSYHYLSFKQLDKFTDKYQKIR